MDSTKRNLLVLAFYALLEYCQAYCSSSNCSGYCCEYNTCCYSVYLTWWFWLIVVGVFILKVSCITCYVRRRRQRAAMFYVQAPVNTTTVTMTHPASIPPLAPVQGGYPTTQQQMPPPYAHHAAQAPEYSQQPQQLDSRINKDTQMLMG